MNEVLDPRQHPYKRDVAASYLEGRVESERFVTGTLHRVHEPLIDIFSDEMGQARTSQAFYGEPFMVYQTEGYWAWGQLISDNYVGWVSALALAADDGAPPTHRVSAQLTRATNDSIKVLGNGPLPMGARLRVSAPEVSVDGSSASFAQSDAGAVPAAHIAAMESTVTDWVAIAEQFENTPYVWGGRSALGIDCSALIQVALQQAGINAPRDSDMQEAALGEPINRAQGLARGDLVFWPGHVGVMQDEARFFHANAFAMSTISEPLEAVEARVGAARTIKRIA